MGILSDLTSKYQLDLSAFTRGMQASGKTPSAPEAEVSPEAHALFQYKQQSVALAKQMAADREKGYNDAVAAGLGAGPKPNFKPTWTDYMIAAETIGKQNAAAMEKQGLSWNAKVYSDLSSLQDRNGKTIPGYEMRLEGFQINKAHMEPPEAVKLLATLRASQLAKEDGRKPTALDALLEIKKIQDVNEKTPALKELQEEALKDMYDLDCNHAISKLYEAVDHEADFKGTVFAHCNFHPADTLMRNGKAEGVPDNGIPITDGAKFEHVVFDGMSDKDELRLNRGQYHDITLKDINRGHLFVEANTFIEGINIEGMHAEFSIGHNAVVSKITANDKTRILTLNMEEGATMAHSDLRAATISQASRLQNAEINGVQFGAGNFANLDVTGSHFNNVVFDGTNLSGTSFAKTRLTGVTFKNTDGMDFTSAALKDVEIEIDPKKLAKLDLGKATSISGLKINGQPVNNPQELQMMQMAAEVNVKNFEYNPEMAKAAAAAPQMASALPQPVQTPQKSTIAYAGDVSLASLGNAIAGFNQAKDLTPRSQPEQGQGWERGLSNNA